MIGIYVLYSRYLVTKQTPVSLIIGMYVAVLSLDVLSVLLSFIYNVHQYILMGCVGILGHGVK